nr:hypothetical protein [uncultured Dyadobacter sp.]
MFVQRWEGRVFKRLKYTHFTYILPEWLKDAEIDKHISVHCFQLTFATLCVILSLVINF